FIVMLIGYIFAMMAGLVGTPVGSHNFSIVFVWIAWWAILILVAVPFFGRGWCAVCPIPVPGEWLQRGAVLAPPDKRSKWINIRPFSADLAKPSTRMDEVFKAFIMLGSAMIYAGVLLGPWGAFKDAAYNVGTGVWFVYAIIFLAIIFMILPGLFTLGILKAKS